MIRNVAAVVRRRRLGEPDEAERVAHWRARSIEERILEVEALRRMWIERLGDPDRPIARVITRRSLREP